ncbi:hypothetical protein ACSFXN_01375 [Planococcus sp. 1R117A]|uniref:Yip1 domain-containing protein n=1 Tax=Planococcus shenhongbingii TaxID=3058398 RepID=A0ABT8NA51_9BACL|nr:hypothetical protein [Planococcus sp. N017]MDN7244731.1 hypothetical protein [Planococcus sp. N017]
MIFDFKFWHYFTRQGELIHNLQENEMRKFNQRLAWIFALGVLLFALREIWGMNTTSLTPYLTEASWDAYTLARWTSLAGTLIWAGLYLAFHSYGVAFLFSKLTKMTFRAAIVMQAYVVALLVIEKALTFFLFAVTGFTMPVSLFSFGPLAVTFLDNTLMNHSFLIFFFNQLTIFTSLIIAVQYRYVRSFTAFSPKLILLLLILIHIVAALAIAAFSAYVPIGEMLSDFTRGGASIE